ncbi:MAG TPA: ABC transporter substrate-binding protein [Alphaproteobacteria bacterium]
MQVRSRAISFAVVVALGAGAAPPAKAADPYDLHVILPLTGGASFVGKGEQANLQALEAHLNKTGGIQGRPLHLIYHDDQTKPQVAVQLTNEVLTTKPPVIMGSSIVAMCNAMAPLMAKGPVMYCMSPGIHPADGGYVFSGSASTYDLVETLVRYYRLKGWTRIAVISSSDATGQDIDRGIDQVFGMPENGALQKVEHEHFTPTDVSVAAQMERIKAAQPQALIAWTTGAAIATIFRAAIQAGLDVPIGTTNGNQTFAQMEQYAAFMPKQLFMPSSLFPDHDGVLTLDPRVEKVQHEMYGILKQADLKSDNMTGTSWDVALVIIEALRKLGPGANAEQIRQYIATLTDFPGINGVYNFKAHPQRGLGSESAVIVRFDAAEKRWVWLSKPGGVPLP